MLYALRKSRPRRDDDKYDWDVGKGTIEKSRHVPNLLFHNYTCERVHAYKSRGTQSIWENRAGSEKNGRRLLFESIVYKMRSAV